LVRALACHARGREFDPRRPRHNKGNSMDQKTLEYKFLLANDLVVYLMYLISNGKEDRDQYIRETLNDWSSRLEFQKQIAEKKLAIETCKDHNDLPVDVAEILIGAHNIHKSMIKGEFKTEIRNLILGALSALKDKERIDKLAKDIVKGKTPETKKI